jgi:hypothetical protein
MGAMSFYPRYFPQLDRLRDIVRTHGEVPFQSFHQEGLRVDPMNLHVQPDAKFRMQPCRFVREGILQPLRDLIN